MPQDENWYDKYVTESGSKQHAAQKMGALAGAGGGLLTAIALATGPVGLALTYSTLTLSALPIALLP